VTHKGPCLSTRGCPSRTGYDWDTTIAHLAHLCLAMMACVPPRMILSRLCQFFNVTPINQIGITVVDLGDIDEGMEAPHSSSLPPTSVKLFEDISRESRHKSLPRTIEDIQPKTLSSWRSLMRRKEIQALPQEVQVTALRLNYQPLRTAKSLFALCM
jgi:hypothetical protein